MRTQLAFELELNHRGHGVNARRAAQPFTSQLLKWIGNKQRVAKEIISFFPEQFGTYYEPFLGSGGVLGVLAPRQAEASDSFGPLIEIWRTLKNDPKCLKSWYSTRWNTYKGKNKVEAYEKIKASYNEHANGADLLFLCRACYGGVVRFRKHDGYMSTPCGVHEPINPESFARRVDEWHGRVQGTNFRLLDYAVAISRARRGDLIYCDPPYSFSQTILYKAQEFSIADLMDMIARAKRRGVYIALSIDGSKKSGNMICDVPIPAGLFEREIPVRVGRSMLRRFQMEGQSLEAEVVTDRLLLTY
jgi:DNA adenine methylase